jgi:hypothetical protein
MTKRNGIANDIKELCLRPFRPLGMLERHVMREGIRVYGQEFYNYGECVFAKVPREMIKVFLHILMNLV